MNNGNLKLATFLFAFGAPLLSAQMLTLRPVPRSIDSRSREQLNMDRSKIVDQGRALCSDYATFKLQCKTQETPGCPKSYSDINDSLQLYNNAADQYNDDVASKLQQRIDEQAKKVKKDEVAIRMLGLHRDAEEFASWSDWLQAANNERIQQVDAAFRDAAKSAVTALISKAIGAGAYKAAALNPTVAAGLIARLEAAGVEDPVLLGAIHRFAAIQGKRQAADASLALLEQLGKAKTLWDLRDMGPDKESVTWQVGGTLLEIFIPDPTTRLIGKLTLDEVRATFYVVNESAIDFPVFNYEMENLENLTEMHLLALRTLSVGIQADVLAKSQASKELANIDQQAERVCQHDN